MVEILPAGRKTQQLCRIGSNLEADVPVKRELCDAVLQSS
jgi:hypothetical protein